MWWIFFLDDYYKHIFLFALWECLSSRSLVFSVFSVIFIVFPLFIVCSFLLRFIFFDVFEVFKMALVDFNNVLAGKWTLNRLFTVTHTDKSTLNFCFAAGIVPTWRTCFVAKQTQLLELPSRLQPESIEDIGPTSEMLFRCHKHKKSKSIFENTWFERHKL